MLLEFSKLIFTRSNNSSEELGDGPCDNDATESFFVVVMLLLNHVALPSIAPVVFVSNVWLLFFAVLVLLNVETLVR